MKPRVQFFTVVLLTLFLQAGALGQDFRATITGQITDPTGAALPGVTVKATRAGANVSTEAITNDEGYYTLPYLVPGTYTVEASLPGFQTLKREGIVLLVADKLNLPLELQVGLVTEKITVVGEQELIQTETASRGQNFDPVKTEEYPLNGRQSYMLMALTPGVIFIQERFGSQGFSGTRGWDTNGSYRINGGGNNQFLLNGAPISLTGSWQLAPNVEAIQEFKVMTNTYDAQFGRTGGGTVNTTLKSGTNDWHGSVFDYMRNSVLDANTIQNNKILFDPSTSPGSRAAAGRGNHIVNQFGGVVGGPIRKDKDFIFFSFEGWREVVPFPVVSSTPPLDFRDGQNFAKYGLKIYDPLTNRLCRDGIDVPGKCFSTYIRDPFPGNVIPANRISPIGKTILALYPAPNADALRLNFFATTNTGRYRYDQPMARWDHVFTEKDRLNTVFTFQHGHEDRSSTGFPPPAERGEIISERRDQNYIVDWVHVVSPKTVADFRLSYGRFRSYFPDGQRSFPFTFDKLGIKQMPVPPTVDRRTAPRINLDQYEAIIGNSFSKSIDNQWDFAPSMTQTRGRHTLHTGFEYVYAARVTAGPGRANGEFTFSRFWTQQYSTRGQGAADGSGVADLLLGIPGSGFIDYNDSFYRTFPYYAVYAQDDWKVSSKLTLNLGLRWDLQVPFVERFNRINSGFDFNAKNPLSDAIVANWAKIKADYDKTNPKYPYPDVPQAILGGKMFPDGNHRRPYDKDWTNFQPRLGVAWNFMDKTVLRAGFGIFHRTATQGNLTDGFNQRTNYIRSLDGDIKPSAGLTGGYSLENPFPNGFIAPSGAKLGLLTNVGRTANFDGRQLIIPRTFEYSFGFERELPWDMVAEASYVGSQTVHDTFNVQLDNVSYDDFLKAQGDPFYLDRSVPNPFFGILPANSDFGSGTGISAYNLRRPYPIFNGITQFTNPWAKYRYDSLQVRVEKRVLASRQTGILTFIFAYTFAKAFEANHRLNDWNLREKPIHELSNLDKPQNIAFSGVWDLPFGTGRRWLSSPNTLTGILTNGWTFDWIWTYYSGYAVGKPDAIFSCGSYKIDKQTENQWFNNDRSCYTTRPSFTLRVVEDRFANIRNPAKPQLNIALAKNFKAGERYKVQFRGESFNTTNTPIRRAPNTDFRSADFGKLPIQQENFPRNIQFALKIFF